jgi:DNA-directed RNA polymerase subunit RPC12/RpoP
VPDSRPRAIEIQREADGKTLHLRCPYCGELDSIAEVGKATRWNKVDEVWDNDGDLHIHWSTDDVKFEHTSFRCVECDETVVLATEMYHSTDDDQRARLVDPESLTPQGEL